MEGLLTKDPAKRLGAGGAEEVKNQPWFENVNWDYIYHKKYESFYIPKIRGDLGLRNFEPEFREITPISLDPESGPYRNFDGLSFEAEALQRQRQ